MPLKLKLAPKLTHKLRLTPQIRLSLNLLQLPLIKLKEYVEQEVEKNPLLELIDSELRAPKEKIEMSWTEEDEEKRAYRESLITQPPTLGEHLLKQLRLFANSDDERKIGELIIGNINDNGYLGCSIQDITKSCKTTKYCAEKVLALIQTFDPIGVGARDLRECLLLQLKAKGQEDSLAGQIVDKYLTFLEKKRYKYIATKLSAKGGSTSGGKVTIQDIKDAIKDIATLEPKPGRSFSAERAIRLIPDAMLRKNKGGYEVILNDGELPRITMNDKYKRMIKEKETPEDAKEYLKERLQAARALIDAINRRKQTIQKIIEQIVSIQKNFLDNGAANFKPMTLEQIAKRIGKHKSTVSRAISNKFLQTPYGILELRHFLSSAIKQEDGNLISSKTIKFEIARLIANENKVNPLTDEEIVNRLKKDGLSISRRTITKYRQQLKILPSKSRRE